MAERTNARYEGDWYYCWLVERRDRAQPAWMRNDGTWTIDADKAQWFARHSDADEVAGEILWDAVACEHGFMLAVPTSDEPCTCGIGMAKLRPHDRSCPMATAK